MTAQPLFQALDVQPSQKLGELWLIDGTWPDEQNVSTRRRICGPFRSRDDALDTIIHQYKNGARDLRLLQCQVIGAETIRAARSEGAR